MLLWPRLCPGGEGERGRTKSEGMGESEG